MAIVKAEEECSLRLRKVLQSGATLLPGVLSLSGDRGPPMKGPTEPNEDGQDGPIKDYGRTLP